MNYLSVIVKFVFKNNDNYAICCVIDKKYPIKGIFFTPINVELCKVVYLVLAITL